MAKYLVEVSHSPERTSCLRSVQILLSTGNHFLTNADWGCMDGEHKAWFIMDATDKDEVKMVIPPAFRPQARIIRLHTFTIDELDEMYRLHSA